jgi:hypothetical protein
MAEALFNLQPLVFDNKNEIIFARRSGQGLI